MKTKKSENQTKDSSQITVRQAGALGGRSTLEHQGVEFFRKIGKKGGATTKKRYGHLFSEFGKRGGRPKRPTLGEPAGERNQ